MAIVWLRNKAGVEQRQVDNASAGITQFNWLAGRSPGLVQASLPPVGDPVEQVARYFPFYLAEADAP